MNGDIARAGLTIDSNIQKVLSDLKQLNNEVNNLKTKSQMNLSLGNLGSIAEQLKSLSNINFGDMKLGSLNTGLGQVKSTLQDITRIMMNGGISNIENIITNFAASGMEARILSRGNSNPQRRAIDRELNTQQKNINKQMKNANKSIAKNDKAIDKLKNDPKNEYMLEKLAERGGRITDKISAITNNTTKLNAELGTLNRMGLQLGQLSAVDGGAVGTGIFGTAGVAVGSAAILTAILSIAARLAVLKKEVEIFAKIAQEGIKFNIDKEGNLAKLNTLTGDKNVAKDLYKEAEDYAKKYTMSIEGVMGALQQLSTYGVHNNDLMEMTKMLSNTSQGDANKLNSQGLALAQVIGKGKLEGQETNQFNNAGLPILQLLEKSAGKSTSELLDMREKGQISPDMVIAAIKKSTEAGGKFFGAMEERAKTFQGKFESLQDTFSIFAGKMSEPIFDFLKDEIENVLQLFDGLDEKDLEDLKNAVANEILPALKDIKQTAMDLIGISDDKSLKDNLQKIIEDTGKVLQVFENIEFVVGNIIKGLTIIGGKLTGIDKSKYAENTEEKLRKVAKDAAEKAKEDAKKNGIDISDWGDVNKIIENSKLNKNKSIIDYERENNRDVTDVESARTRSNEKQPNLRQNMNRDVTDVESARTRTRELAENKAIIDSMLNPKAETKTAFDSYNTDVVDKDAAKKAAEYAKKIADAFDKVTDSVNNTIKAFGGLGTAFDKLSYEKFSPTKLKNRLTKRYKQTKAYQSNLNILKDKLSPEEYKQLLDMGENGYGVADGLAKMNDADLSASKGMLNEMNKIGLDVGLQKMQLEVTGKVIVEGVTTEGQVVSVKNLLATELVKDKRSQSLSPSVLNGL